MPTMVYTNAYISINGTEVSTHVKSVNITYEAELLDDTVMGTGGTRSNFPGLKNWSIEVNFLQDYDAGSVDATLFALVGAPAFSVNVRPVNIPASTSNPEYHGPCVIESYPPLTGEVGALGTATVMFKPSGNNCNLIRSTAPVAIILATGANAGAPGVFTPPGAVAPQDFAALTTPTLIVANPATTWTGAQHVVLLDLSKAYWHATTFWTVGMAP